MHATVKRAASDERGAVTKGNYGTLTLWHQEYGFLTCLQSISIEQAEIVCVAYWAAQICTYGLSLYVRLIYMNHIAAIRLNGS